jgi:hypothetical protein
MKVSEQGNTIAPAHAYLRIINQNNLKIDKKKIKFEEMISGLRRRRRF